MSKKIFTKTLLPLSAVIAVGTGVSTLASCSKDNYTTITVSCTAVPHDEILKAANNIAHIYGYKIVTNVQTGYDTENPAVANGDADANFFQHHPYLEAYNTSAASDKQLASVLDVHLEPIAL
jgi:D-methionine transport system substrate-binding protein